MAAECRPCLLSFMGGRIRAIPGRPMNWGEAHPQGGAVRPERLFLKTEQARTPLHT